MGVRSVGSVGQGVGEVEDGELRCVRSGQTHRLSRLAAVQHALVEPPPAPLTRTSEGSRRRQRNVYEQETPVKRDASTTVGTAC